MKSGHKVRKTPNIFVIVINYFRKRLEIFSLKWIILFGLVSFYVKYELTKRGIIKNESKEHNVPYTNELGILLSKIKKNMTNQFAPAAFQDASFSSTH